ncbi:MAG TPA: hypothetical protein EYG75_05855 [Campylobacterales bacterium]|nr:hypothetical protein [Campylobacterales bacterium]
MSKFLILDVSVEENVKTGDQFFIMKAFGKVQKFGKVSNQTISIRLKDIDEFNKYKQQIMKTVDLNIVLPYSDYSFMLSS